MFFALFLLLITAGLSSAQCKDAVSTKDMQDCADAQWKKSDDELNRVYAETLKKLKAPDADRLRKAQRAWITYRDAHCDAEYQLYAGGSIAAVSLTQCRATLTDQRTKLLQDTYSPNTK
jgi:uncharacterized protein YecT (DUF1311 family)